MIPNHAQFLTAIQDKKKVWVKFYSKADNGVLERACAPMDYGPGGGVQDGLNRYWLWDYASDTGAHALGLLPQQIVDLQVLGEAFDPAQLAAGAKPEPVVPRSDSSPATIAPTEVPAFRFSGGSWACLANPRIFTSGDASGSASITGRTAPGRTRKLPLSSFFAAGFA